MENRKENVEELIIQGLNHRERRNILKVISLAFHGTFYSDILGEIGLNTGRMNYHLKQLEGLIERNGDRRYHLTPLGKSALTVFSSLTDDLENGYEEYLSQVRTPRGEGFIVWANRWFGFVVMSTFSAFTGLAAFMWFAVRAGNFTEVLYYYLFTVAVILLVLLVWLRDWVRHEAERFQSGWKSLLDMLRGKYR